MKLLLIGLWVVVVALGSTFATATIMSRKGTAAAPEAEHLQSEKTRVLNVPIIADGAVKGFVSVQFEFTTAAGAAKDLPVPPEVYLVDEAFRTLYSDPSLDFHHLDRYDLGKLTKHLVETTNAHLGAPVIKDVLIADMNYSPRDGTANAPASSESTEHP